MQRFFNNKTHTHTKQYFEKQNLITKFAQIKYFKLWEIISDSTGQ